MQLEIWMRDPVAHRDQSPLPQSTCSAKESSAVFSTHGKRVKFSTALGKLSDLLGMRFQER